MFTFNRNLNKTFTFVLCNLPILKQYHQSAISWQPVEASRFKSKRLIQTDDNISLNESDESVGNLYF